MQQIQLDLREQKYLLLTEMMLINMKQRCVLYSCREG